MQIIIFSLKLNTFDLTIPQLNYLLVFNHFHTCTCVYKTFSMHNQLIKGNMTWRRYSTHPQNTEICQQNTHTHTHTNKGSTLKTTVKKWMTFK